MKLNHVLSAYGANDATDNSGIVLMSEDQIELVNGAARDDGWVATVSGDCNKTGSSCNFLAAYLTFLSGKGG